MFFGTKPILKCFYIILFLIVSACSTTAFENQHGEPAAFFKDKCDALSQWVEPLQWRYPDSNPGRWQENISRDRMKFLFTDPYFVPIFGSTVDSLTDRQMKSIHDTLQSTRRAKNPCRNKEYLMSIYPGIFIGRIFNPSISNTIFSKSFVDNHARLTRSVQQHKDRQPTKETIEIIQKRIAQLGFEVGLVDGVIGPKTSNAVSQYKKSKNMSPATGELTPALLARLDAYHIPEPRVVKSTSTPSVATKEIAKTEANSTQDNSQNKFDLRSLQKLTERLGGGEVIELSGPQKSYFAGMAGAVLEQCPSIGSFSERLQLASLVASVSLLDPIINIYSNDNFGQTMSHETRSAGLFNTGYVAGNRMGCGRLAGRMISALFRSM